MTVETYEQLFREYNTKLVRLLAHGQRGSCLMLAEDAASFAWMTLWTRREADDVDLETVRGWLFTTAKHKLWRMLDKREVNAEPGTLFAVLTAPEHDPLDRLEAHEQLGHLADLKYAQQRALVLQAQGYSYHEIGAMFGHPTPVGVVNNTWANRHIREGRDALRKAIQQGAAA